MAFLSHPLSNDVIKRIAVALAPDEQGWQHKRQQKGRFRGLNTKKAPQCKLHGGFVQWSYICRLNWCRFRWEIAYYSNANDSSFRSRYQNSETSGPSK